MKQAFYKIAFFTIINLVISFIFLTQSNPLFKGASAVADACDNPYMPFRQGDEIEYKTFGLNQESTHLMRVIAVDAGKATIEYEIRSPQKMVMKQNIFCKNGAITTDTYMDFSTASSNVQMKAITKDVSGQLIPPDIKVGSVWDNKFTISFQYQGVNMPEGFNNQMVISTTNKVLAEEKVTVPAGTFTALKVESTSTMNISMGSLNIPTDIAARAGEKMPDISKYLQQAPVTTTSMTQYQWWVKNIGLVKAVYSTGGRDWEYVAVRIGMSSLWDNPTVEAIAEKAVAPTAVAVAVVNSAIATQSVVSIDIFRYLLFFISQPLFLIRRKKQKAWGIVYNSLSRLPVDLAIVRLQDLAIKKVITTQVTDTNGRFSFLVPAGKYQLTVNKKDFIFPSVIIKSGNADEQYLDLYHGQTIEIGKEGAVLTQSIPVDPQLKDLGDAKIRKQFEWQKYQGIIALASPIGGFISFLIKPSLSVTLLFILSIIMYLFFRRFALIKNPKKWGKVQEEKTITNLPGAVLRIFALPFNKLVEYRVTDKQGRYNFLVGNSKFFLTVNKDNYQTKQSAPYDFSGKQTANIIAEDINLQKK